MSSHGEVTRIELGWISARKALAIEGYIEGLGAVCGHTCDSTHAAGGESVLALHLHDHRHSRYISKHDNKVSVKYKLQAAEDIKCNDTNSEL